SSSAWPAWMSPPAAIIFRCSICSAAVIGCADSAWLRRPYSKTTTAATTAVISAILIARIISVLRLSFFVGRRRRGASGSLVRALRGRRVAVGRDPARLVDHPVRGRGGVLRLHDAVRVAVDRRHHRSRQAARDAAIVQAAILGTVRRTAARCLPRRRASGKPG